MIEKISPEKRQELEASEVGNQLDAENRILQNMLGFTRVFRVMRDLKKVCQCSTLFMVNIVTGISYLTV